MVLSDLVVGDWVIGNATGQLLDLDGCSVTVDLVAPKVVFQY